MSARDIGLTAFGRIPGFSKHTFPSESIPYLSLVANIGLCFFLIGLGIDASIIRRNARLSATIAATGVIIPFGLGVALAVPLYKHFIDSSQVSYTHFLLFTGVAYSITDFPVLYCILTEPKLLDTTIGIVVLFASVGNDIIGWTLLALNVALVNAGSGLTALWMLLVCIGWTLFMLLLIHRVLSWCARATGSIGTDQLCYSYLLRFQFCLAQHSSLMSPASTQFSAFPTGIVMPRDGGLAIALTEKLEDMVPVIFLPPNFTLSGLLTDLASKYSICKRSRRGTLICATKFSKYSKKPSK
ncbi:Cation/H+ exchanger [Lactarius indigo]|nr:Cation/H+ exchanger [Lactarius indigo]